MNSADLLPLADLAELAPTRLRGNLITIQSLMITGGQIAACESRKARD
jgi:hypothetical protein